MTARRPRLVSENPTMQPRPLPDRPTNADLARGQADLHDCLEGARAEIRKVDGRLNDFVERVDGIAERQDGLGARVDNLAGDISAIARRVGATKPGEIKTASPVAWLSAGGALATILVFLARLSPAWPAIVGAGRAVLSAAGAH